MKGKFKDYDVVIAQGNIHGVPRGARGVVLLVLDDEKYEVEFVDENGNTIKVDTVNGDDLEAFNGDTSD